MRILVKLEKAGQLFVSTEVPVHKPHKLLKRAQKALKHLCEEYPDLPLFDNDALLKFQRID